MKLTKSILPLAVFTALGVGFANEASANLYATSGIEIDNLAINITPAAGATIRNFNYNLNNSAFLNGNGGATNATCNGTPGIPGPGTNNCGAGFPADALVYNAPGSTVNPANNAFALQGPGANQYSRADSVIYSSQLTGDPTTHQQALAESELQGGSSASAGAIIQSVTGFTFTFTTTAAGDMTISFNASTFLRAFSNDPAGFNQSAQANVAVLATLSRDTGGYLWQWNPNGLVDTNCIAAGTGATCAETADGFNIGNNAAGISTDPADQIKSSGGMVGYSVTFRGLQAGDHTLTLRTENSTNISRSTVQVPEPGISLLLGTSLIGWSVNVMRRKRSLL